MGWVKLNGYEFRLEDVVAVVYPDDDDSYVTVHLAGGPKMVFHETDMETFFHHFNQGRTVTDLAARPSPVIPVTDVDDAEDPDMADDSPKSNWQSLDDR